MIKLEEPTDKKELISEEKKEFDKEINKMILHSLFPILTSIPLPWLIIGAISLLFGLLTCIL